MFHCSPTFNYAFDPQKDRAVEMEDREKKEYELEEGIGGI